MRTLLTPTAFGFVALLVSPLAAGAAPPSAEGGTQMEFVAPDDPAAPGVKRTAETAIRWLGAKMLFELKTALAKGNPESAVAICHLKAVSSGGQALPGMPSIKSFKLTSKRLLNAANAPDAAEQAALERVQLSIEQGDQPDELLVQRITLPDHSVEWRVYRPMAVLPLCMTCHGDPAAQSPELQTLLKERASANAAIGYAQGDWRGFLRVTIVPPAAP